MTTLTLDKVLPILTVEEVGLIRPAFNGRTGKLKSSKPFSYIGRDDSTDEAIRKGSANYAWRMLVFDFFDSGKNACMPVTADFDLSAALYNRDEGAGCKESNREARRAELKGRLDMLEALIKRVESVMPVTAQVGAMRWGRALGMLR